MNVNDKECPQLTLAKGTADVGSKAFDACEFGPSNATAHDVTGDDSSSVLLNAEVEMDTSYRWACNKQWRVLDWLNQTMKH